MLLQFSKGWPVSFVLILIFVCTSHLQAQDQGFIYKPASTVEGKSVLDPNSTGNVFDDGIPFYSLPELQNEPLGDPRTGASGGHTELIAAQDGSPAAYMFYDSEKEAVLFRVRLAGQSTASKGYSFLFNTSFETFGPKAENFTQTNPGFQFEVVLETGTGVTIYELNENGVTDTKTLSGGEDPYFQKAFSDITANGEVGYFYDFYVPLSELDGLLSATDGFRAVATTVTRAQSGITGTTSDVAGVDDDLYRDRNSAFVNYIESMPEITLNDISGTDGDGFGNLVSAVPTLRVPTEGESTLSGTSVEADGTSIVVRIYDENDQEIANETTTVSGNSWSLSGLAPFDAGQYVTAEANADGKDPSGESDPVFVRSDVDISQCTSPLSEAVRGGNKFNGFVPNIPSDATQSDLIIRLYEPDENGDVGPLYISTSSDESGAASEGIASYAIFTSTGGGIEFELGSTGGNPYNIDLFVTAQYTGECESQPVASGVSGTFISKTPVISPAQINEGDTSVSGTSNAGAEITVFVNGVDIGTTTADGNGEWTLSGLDSSAFSDGDEVTAQALDPDDGALLSAISNVVIVGTLQTQPPVISGDYLNGNTRIEGSSIEGGSVEIDIFINNIFAGSTSTDAFGSWEFILEGGESLATDDLITARARAPGKSESDLSDAVEVKADQSSPPVVDEPILTGDETISVSGGGDTVNLFVDGEFIASKTGPNTVLFEAGIDYDAGDLYKGADVTATNQDDNSTESEPSAAVTVQGVESFLIEYNDSDGNELNSGVIEDQEANKPFFARITALDGSGNTFTNFSGTAIIDISVAITGESLQTGSFTSGTVVHEITAIQGSEDVSIVALSTEDPLVTGTSNQFTINNPDANVLTLTSLSRNRVRTGSEETKITLTGVGFVLNSSAQLDGTDLETTYISDTELEVTIAQSSLDTEGDYPIRVVNPEPQGGTSNELNFEVTDIAVLYSRKDGIWGDSESWSEIELGGAASEFEPDVNAEVIIGGGNTITIPSGENVRNRNSITVQNNSKLVVADGGSLDIEESGNLVIETGAIAEIESSGTLSSDDFIQVDNEALFCNFGESTPSLQLSRQLNGPEGWRYISSPVETDLATLFSSVWLQGGVGADTENGVSNVYRWPLDQANQNNSNDFRPFWEPVEDFRGSSDGGNGEGTIMPGEGYLMYLFGSDYDGSNQLPQTLTVTGTEFEPFTKSVMNTEPSGWTLLGNPFACAISFEELFNQTGTEEITGSVYVWDDSGAGSIDEPQVDGDEETGSGSWKTYSLDGDGIGEGDLAGGRIAPFQAFFVQNNESTESSVNFAHESKTTELPVDFLFKQNERNIIRMEVEGEISKNSTWIRFSENGKPEFTLGDAHQLQPMSANYTYLATQKQDGSLLDIGHYDIPGQNFELPVIVETTIPGDYTLKATDFSIPENRGLVFKDLEENITIKMDDSFEYQFTIHQAAKKRSDPFHILEGAVAAKSDQHHRFVITNEHAEADIDLPEQVTLKQNYPNPFNPTTRIQYELPEASNVSLEVFELTGKKVATLVNGGVQAGRHAVQFNASNLSSGVYVYRLKTNQNVISRKLTVIK